MQPLKTSIWLHDSNKTASGKAGTLQRADGRVEMISDNPSVPNQIAQVGEMHVLGRVVTLIRKI